MRRCDKILSAMCSALGAGTGVTCSFLPSTGDERAAKARAVYGKPLKPVILTGVGVLPIREPFPRPV